MSFSCAKVFSMNRLCGTVLVLLFQFFSLQTFAQLALERKELTATKIDAKIRLDGVLDESAWINAPIASQFINTEPIPGIVPSQESEIRVLYDDEAIYIGAFLYDTHPEKILSELSQRDRLGNTDWFGVIIDSYQDGINGLEFIVTPSGIQFDAKFSGIASGQADYSEDVSWDAVWNSSTKITSNGWVCELKIPYSALRFKNHSVQNWNVNFMRQIRRTREKSFWNPIQPNIRGIINQSGTLTNLENIKSPLRLQFNPYIANYSNVYRDAAKISTSTNNVNAGLDMKYGINDAFTLDMTVIPDFGQVQFDNNILNLSPFEVRFQENRPFFTEGTELFNKGNLLYSRRIGGTPVDYNKAYVGLNSGEKIISSPTTTPILNASKISGRLNNGLGVGVFNAITGATYAKVLNEKNQVSRQVETSPLVNYNVFVLDQNLRNNSSVTFVNTSVLRMGSTYDANVTGVLFTLRDKRNNYALSGNSAISQRFLENKQDIGHQYSLNFQKTSGNWQWYTFYNEESYNYNPNDLGYLYSPNERTTKGSVTYNNFKPKRNFNRWNINMSGTYTRLQKPDAFNLLYLNASFFAMTKNFLAFNFSASYEPIGSHDYFEPRTSDFSRFYELPSSAKVGGWISTDYRKKVALDVEYYYRKFNEDSRKTISYGVSPRWRINDHMSFIYRLNVNYSYNDVGFVSKNYEPNAAANAIHLGRRGVQTYEQLLTAKYTFNSKMNLSLAGRYYWSKVTYSQISQLQNNGSLEDFQSANIGQYHTLYNFFNIDLIYTWRFAPGSDIIVAYKTGINGSFPSNYDYFASVRDFNALPQNHNFSVKCIYFVDFHSVKTKFLPKHG
jgi:Domain of unknown function (DUF5916)